MKVILENFQGHANSTIETVGGITAITGSTNAGKTSFIRAISHLKNNNLRGTEYVRKGTDKCTITVDDVQRIKAKSENCYMLGTSKTEALRGGVPIEVSKALNLSDDCIQMQHDAIFLLNKSPGVVATKLAELIDLDIAHRAVKVVDKDRRDTYAEVNALALGIKKNTARIEELAVVDDIDIALSSMERKQAIIDSYEENQSTVRELVKNAVVRLQELNSMPNVSKLAGVSGLIDKCGSIQVDQNALIAKKNLLGSAINYKWAVEELPEISRLQGLTGLLSTAETLYADRAGYEALSKVIASIRSVAKQRMAVPKTISSALAEVEELCMQVQDIRTYMGGALLSKVEQTRNTAALNKLNAKYKATMGDRCPLCKGKVPK